MAWKKNRTVIAEGFRDLEYMPRGRAEWDFTLASLAYSVRRVVDRKAPDLNAWAARHGVASSARYGRLGGDAMVLWHGTSRQRAGKIAQHGLFHKGGLWATLEPRISHGFYRRRNESFGAEGAVVCMVLDRRKVSEGIDFTWEDAQVLRFHHGLGPEVVEYVLDRNSIQFVGPEPAAGAHAWTRGKFKRLDGRWVPVQNPPVRYDAQATYGSLDAFLALCLGRLIAELGEATAIDIFSTAYAMISPPDALEHQRVFELIDEECRPGRRRGRFQLFKAGH
jgi:hypothetical protein